MKKTAIVTGAYGAIGQAIVAGIAEKEFRILLAGRDESRLRNAVAEIGKKIPGAELVPVTVDLSRKSEIVEFSKSFQGSLHILVNNAATAPRQREETPEGIEMQLAVNVLSYYWMITFFHPIMTEREYARIVNVASYWAGGLDPDDLEFRRRRYDNDAAYRQSKQADRMLTRAFADRLKDKGITVNACHPGDVNSKLSNDLGFGGHESPAEGATTPVWLATSSEVQGITGKYFARMSEDTCPFMRDDHAVEKLYTICGSY
jgi:NAD(P)-dependent dehydrogenase (short-subunit alcohol dehydrogenase family)